MDDCQELSISFSEIQLIYLSTLVIKISIKKIGVPLVFARRKNEKNYGLPLIKWGTLYFLYHLQNIHCYMLLLHFENLDNHWFLTDTELLFGKSH